MLYCTGMDNAEQASNSDSQFGTKVSYIVLVFLHLVAIFFFKQLGHKMKETQLITAHNLKYSSFESRFKSFEKSRCLTLMHQFICGLCEAGFYYSGNGENDGVACFSCNIHLKNWEHNDSPWVQHARWSKECSFLLLCKGKDFVNRIHRILEVDGEIDDQMYLREYYDVIDSYEEDDSSTDIDFSEDVGEGLYPVPNDSE